MQKHRYNAFFFLLLCLFALPSLSRAAIPSVNTEGTWTATKGSSFHYVIKASDSPTSFSVTGLPSGLTFDPTAGLISGIPNTTGVYSLTLGAKNSSGTGTSNLILNVTADLAKGNDVSWLQQMAGSGFEFFDTDGKMRDPDQVNNCLMILKERGIDLVRIRVLVPPIIAPGWDNELWGNSTIDEVIPVAVKAKALGLRILISLDYSWTLADPGNQRIPINWVNNIANRPNENPISLLAAEVSANTTEVLTRLKAAGVTPEFVALGNEITNGMLLHVENKGSTAITRTSPNYGSRGSNLAKFVNAGYYATKAIDPNIKVVIHIDRAHDDGLDVGFFNTLKQYNGHWDVSATDTSADLVSDISQTVDDLAAKFNTPGFGGEGVLMMEMEPPTVYPNNTYNPYVNVSSGTSRDFNFVTDILKLMRAIPGGKGVGALYWEAEDDPDWRGYLQATWANEEPTPVLDAFLPPGFVAPVSLTSLPQATAKSGVAFSYQIGAANSPTSFSAAGLPPGLTLNPTSGLISGTPGNVSGPRGYVVYNVALGAVTSQGTVTGNLRLKVNGSVSGSLPPAFFSSPSATTNVGDLYWYTIQASNVDPSTIKITSPLPPGLKAVSSSEIQGTPTTPGIYPIGFSVTNSGGTAKGSLILTVNPAPQKPVITSSLNVSGSLTSPFNYAITTNDSTSILGATGLPPGLTISFDGLMSGTPTKAGSFPVTISATNIAGTSTATLNITVEPSTVNPPAPIISSSSSATGTVLQPFSFTITASNTPTAFTATGLPSGLSINPTTGVISGTPTGVGTSTISLSVSNSGGLGTGTLTLTVYPPVPVISSTTSASAIAGTAFSYAIIASNTPTSFNATGLPIGLTINTTTGLISGTPTVVGSSIIHLSATNSGGTSTGTLTLTVNPPPVIIPPSPVISSVATASATAGTAFTYTIVASNSPTSFNATGLPAGLTVNTTNGVISGTPSAVGSATVHLSATNSGGTGTGTLTLTVKPPIPVISSAVTASATTGTAFTYTITASNTPTSFNATGLAAGLTVNTTTGLISGTPTSAGSAVIHLSATNSGGTGTSTLTLTVKSAPPIISSVLTATGTVGKTFSYGITASNTPTAFNATGLPAGLSVSATTGAISGTPTTAGSFTVTLSATNSGGTGTATLAMTINPSAPVISSALAATGTVGKAFSYAISASNSPTAFNATGLPAGLSVSATTGAISGTATAAGSFTVTLSATNAGGTGTATLALRVNSPAPTLSGATAATGTVGKAFSFTITASNAPTSFGATGLPPGLSLNASSGLISGTPTTAGTFTVTLSATNATGTGTATLGLIINTLNSVPAGWFSVDVGSPSLTGSGLATSPGAFTLTAGGNDIWGSSDQFHYVYVPWIGDGVLITHIEDLSNTHPRAKAALMFRQSLAANAAHGLVDLTPAGSGSLGAEFNSRLATAGLTTATNAPGVNPPAWLKLVRTGTILTSFSSADGRNWTPVPLAGTTFQPALIDPIEAGLVVCSHNGGALATAHFDNVTFLVTPAALTGTSATTGISLHWNPNPNSGVTSETAYEVDRSLTGKNSWTTLTTGLPKGTISYVDTSIAAGLSYDYRVRALAANGEFSNYATVTVVPAVPVIGSVHTASGTVGSAFTYTITASNGASSFGASGLPAGLTLNATSGVISGTPTTAGSFTVTLSATNAGGAGTATLGVTISSPSPSFSSAPTASGNNGSAFNFALLASNSPSSYRATGLPPGLSLNTSTGVISGTPTVTGTFTVTISATNAAGTTTAQLTVTIHPPLTLTWSGSVSGIWDTTTSNWLNGVATTPYSDGDAVLFNNSGAGGAVTLSDLYSPSAVTFANSTKGYLLDGPGTLNGPMALTKTGAGALTINSTEVSLSGSVTVNLSPVVRVSSTGSLEEGMMVSGTGIPDGTLIATINSPTTLTLTKSARWSGTGILLFGYGNAYTGGSEINGGTVVLANDAANYSGLGVGTVTLDGGTLQMYDNRSDYDYAYWNIAVPTGTTGTLLADSRINFYGKLSGGGIFNLYVPYVRTTLFGDWSAFTGAINVTTGSSGGDFRISNSYGYANAAIYLGPKVNAYNNIGGGTYSIGELSGDSTSDLSNGGGSITWSVGGLNTDATYAGVISGGNTIKKVGAGTWALTGANTYTGPTTVSAGGLLVNGSLTSPTTVAGGAGLGGSGSIAANVTVTTGGSLGFNVTTGGVSGLTIKGNLNLTGTITVSPILVSGSLARGTYTILSYTGTLTGTPTFVWSAPPGSPQAATFDTSHAGVIKITIP